MHRSWQGWVLGGNVFKHGKITFLVKTSYLKLYTISVSFATSDTIQQSFPSSNVAIPLEKELSQQNCS